MCEFFPRALYSLYYGLTSSLTKSTSQNNRMTADANATVDCNYVLVILRSCTILLPCDVMHTMYPRPFRIQNISTSQRNSHQNFRPEAHNSFAIMAKKRKSLPPSAVDSKMDLDNDHPSAAPPLKNSVFSANTHAGITKSVRLPRGKGRRAQRLRKEKGAERAEEVQARTERKVERSRGKGRRKGERNVSSRL